MLTTSELLEAGICDIEQLNFQAENRDGALAAFENFRRAVIRVMTSKKGAHSCERCTLDNVAPKKRYLQFLLDFADRSFMHRSRVSEVIRRLLDSSPWQEAARSDPFMLSAIRALVDDCDATSQRGSSQGSSRDQSLESKVDRVDVTQQVAQPSQPSAKSGLAPANPWSTESLGECRTATCHVWSQEPPQKKASAACQDIRVPVDSKKAIPAASPSASTGTNPFDVAGIKDSAKAVPRACNSSRTNTNPFSVGTPVSPRRLPSTNPFKTDLDRRQDSTHFSNFPLYGKVS